MPLDASRLSVGAIAPETSHPNVRLDAPQHGARELVRAVARALDEDDLCGALGILNARTRFRYTGLYRAEPPLLRNVQLFDRENPALRQVDELRRIDETYCSIVCATELPFNTANAPLDERLGTHPARDTVISYAGVPLRLPSGRPWGVLCHYDSRPRLLPPAELAALAAVSPVLLQWAMEHVPA
jgi:GAF domain-containing protein